MNTSAVIKEIDGLIEMLEKEKVAIIKDRDSLPAYPLTDEEELKSEKDLYYRTPM
jgi:hypothetical protein